MAPGEGRVAHSQAPSSTPTDARVGDPSGPVDLRPGRVVARDAWYSICHASAVRKRRPLARMLDSCPLVVWRDRDDVIRVHDDRCLHRRVPLSLGKVVDGHLRCPYHGWCYDGTGACVEIPSLGPGAEPPSRFGLRTWPSLVRYGLVWVWHGAPERADPDLVPDIPFLHPDRPAPCERQLSYEAAHELVVENLLDLTHLDVLHAGIIGDPGGGFEEVKADFTEEIVTMTRLTKDRKPPKAQALMYGFPKHQDFLQVTRVHVRTGACLVATHFTPPGWAICLYLPCTPESADRTRMDYSMAITGPWWYQRMFPPANRIIARQDHRVLRAQHPNYQRDTTIADRSVPADAAALRYRSTRRALLMRQLEGDFSYAPGWRQKDPAEELHVERMG
jgi:phenylpropionate dioxygenase-like ring-hydroxylating dioxygenase large terminal subunit